jgi:hypothetical protein
VAWPPAELFLERWDDHGGSENLAVDREIAKVGRQLEQELPGGVFVYVMWVARATVERGSVGSVGG